MFPLPWPIAALSLLLRALAGMAIGALTGWFVSLVTRRGSQAAVKDGFLGLFGYFAGFIGCIVVWPRNAITYRVEGVTLINPEWVAIFGAVLFPLLNELYRWRKGSTTSLL